MAYKTKLPVRKEKDIFELPHDEALTGESFEMKKEYLELPKDNMDAYKDDNKFETQEEKEADIYSLPKEDNEDGSLFRTNENEVITDVNDELMAEEIPIKIVDKETLSVNANGKWHTVKRQDLMAYQSKFANEDGIDVPITRYRVLSGISGDNESLDKIALEIKNTFAKIDEKLGGMETTQTDY